MLTTEKLKEYANGEIFANGVTINNSSGVNMSNDDSRLFWVACKGGIEDWAIYIHYDSDLQYVKRSGDKVHSERDIKKLVPCDDEVFALYRK